MCGVIFDPVMNGTQHHSRESKRSCLHNGNYNVHAKSLHYYCTIMSLLLSAWNKCSINQWIIKSAHLLHSIALDHSVIVDRETNGSVISWWRHYVQLRKCRSENIDAFQGPRTVDIWSKFNVSTFVNLVWSLVLLSGTFMFHRRQHTDTLIWLNTAGWWNKSFEFVEILSTSEQWKLIIHGLSFPHLLCKYILLSKSMLSHLTNQILFHFF